MIRIVQIGLFAKSKIALWMSKTWLRHFYHDRNNVATSECNFSTPKGGPIKEVSLSQLIAVKFFPLTFFKAIEIDRVV